MSDDLTRVLEPLRGDLAGAGLPDPSAVRRRGERRRITVILTSALAVALVLGGAVGAASYLAAPGSARVPPASGPASGPASPPASGLPSPSASSEPTAELAPETAILPELRGRDGYQGALEFRTYLSPPRPCDRKGYPSDAHPRLYRPAHGMVPDAEGQGPTVQLEFVVRYLDGSGGAKAYLAELRSAIRTCPGRVAGGMGRGDHKWSIVESDFVGDESVLVRLRGSGKGYDVSACCTDLYLAVVRDGDIVVALTDLGWEGGGGDGRFAKRSAGRALEFARSLR